MILNKAISEPKEQQLVMEGSVSSKTDNLDKFAQLDEEKYHPNLIS